MVSPSDDLVLSVSRDMTAIAWKRASANTFGPSTMFRAGSRYVNSVAYLQPTDEAAQGELNVLVLGRLN